MEKNDFQSVSLMDSFDIRDEELKAIRDFAPKIRDNLGDLVDHFTANLKSIPRYREYFTTDKKLEKVSYLLMNYWEDFLQGKVTREYISSRIHIGKTHAHIKLPVNLYLGAMNLSLTWFINKIIQQKLEPKKFKILINGISKLINMDTTLVVTVYCEHSMEEMDHTINEIKNFSHHFEKGDLVEIDSAKKNEVFTLINKIVKNLKTKALQAEMLSKGDYSSSIVPLSESDTLGIALSNMTETLRHITEISTQVANGNYEHKLIEEKNSKDMLSQSINLMVTQLKETAKKNENDMWMKNGLAELSLVMRGEKTMEELCKGIVTFLSKYINANLGLMYLNFEDTVLKLISSYAHNYRKILGNTYSFGEGIVGQVALEKERMIISDIPEEHIQIDTGIGISVPKFILAVPILIENELKGVIEFGSFKSFTQRDLEFIDLVCESIGISLKTCEKSMEVKSLLEETQRQSEKLMIQQEQLQSSNNQLEHQAAILKASEEELLKANDDLEKKSKVLRKSEEKMRTKSEELKKSNEELSKKSKMLEKQKEQIESKNKEIEIKKTAIEAKARDLELTSKYKSEFLANMSHELRTPLNSLLILAESLSKNEEGNLNSEQVEYAEIIASGGRDLLTLINDILDLSKVEAGKLDIHFCEVSIPTMTENLQRQFKVIARRKEIDFKVEMSPDVPIVFSSDGRRVEQILKNLLSNAFKFTSKGHIRLTVNKPKESFVYNKIEVSPSDWIELSVNDTGSGIDKDKFDAIFEAFQQEDGSNSRNYNGTGLGLTISKELSHLLGGCIQVRSEKGKGSQFSLFLPIMQKKAAHSKPCDIHIQPKTQQEVKENNAVDTIQTKTPLINDDRENIHHLDNTVLIISSDESCANKILNIARNTSRKGVIAPDANTGVIFAHLYKPNAIFLDLDNDKGIEALAQLKNNLSVRHIPIYCLSSLEPSNINQLKGAMGTISKEFNEEAMRKILDEVNKFSQREVKNVLLIEGQSDAQEKIAHLIKNPTIHPIVIESEHMAIDILKEKNIDCMIVDFECFKSTIFQFIGDIEKDPLIDIPPTLLHVQKELSLDEKLELETLSSKRVIKEVCSLELLLYEVTLYAHCIQEALTPEQKDMFNTLFEKENDNSRITILIVDDDMRNLYALSSELQKIGFNVHKAHNGEVALDKLKHLEHVDIILMDIMMPVIDGYEAIRRIRNMPEHAHLPIVACTAKAMKDDKIKVIEVGANEYVTKPIELDQLIQIIKGMVFVDHGSSVQEQIRY